MEIDMPNDIQWFPGHMRKALNDISDKLTYIDVIYETIDARIPFSSRNPELNQVATNKPRIIVMNKSDLADETKTKEWIEYYRSQGIHAVACDATHKKGLDILKKTSYELCKETFERAKAKGRIGRPLRAMVVGIPNSGKSTLINALCNRKIAITGDMPGVTRNFSWAKSDSLLELMDMPGVLWPNLGTKRSQLCLTITGAVKSNVVDVVQVSYDGMKLLEELYPNLLYERYKLAKPNEEGYIEDDYERFLDAARKKGCILSGGRVDEERFGKLFLDDFKAARIGRITLESPSKPESGISEEQE